MQSNHSQALIAVILFLTLSMASCANTSPPTPILEASIPTIESPTSTAAPTSTEVYTPTVEAATSTPRPTPTELPAIPELDLAKLDEVIFESGPPGCALPCWNGLEIGVSNLDDLAEATQRAFGFNALLYPPPDRGRRVPDFKRYGHRWEFYHNEQYYGDFVFVAWYNEKTELLEGLSFSLTLYWAERRPDFHSQRFLQEVGLPKEWLVNYEPGGQGVDGYHIRFSSSLYYDNGIHAYQYYEIPADITSPNSPVDFCLSQYTSFSLSISEPVTRGTSPEDLSPLQQRIPDHSDYKSLEEALNVSLDEIMRQAERGDVCLTIEFPGGEE